MGRRCRVQSFWSLGWGTQVSEARVSRKVSDKDVSSTTVDVDADHGDGNSS